MYLEETDVYSNNDEREKAIGTSEGVMVFKQPSAQWCLNPSVRCEFKSKNTGGILFTTDTLNASFDPDVTVVPAIPIVNQVQRYGPNDERKDITTDLIEKDGSDKNLKTWRYHREGTPSNVQGIYVISSEGTEFDTIEQRDETSVLYGKEFLIKKSPKNAHYDVYPTAFGKEEFQKVIARASENKEKTKPLYDKVWLECYSFGCVKLEDQLSREGLEVNDETIKKKFNIDEKSKDRIPEKEFMVADVLEKFVPMQYVGSINHASPEIRLKSTPIVFDTDAPLDSLRVLESEKYANVDVYFCSDVDVVCAMPNKEWSLKNYMFDKQPAADAAKKTEYDGKESLYNDWLNHWSGVFANLCFEKNKSRTDILKRRKKMEQERTVQNGLLKKPRLKQRTEEKTTTRHYFTVSPYFHDDDVISFTKPPQTVSKYFKTDEKAALQRVAGIVYGGLKSFAWFIIGQAAFFFLIAAQHYGIRTLLTSASYLASTQSTLSLWDVSMSSLASVSFEPIFEHIRNNIWNTTVSTAAEMTPIMISLNALSAYNATTLFRTMRNAIKTNGIKGFNALMSWSGRKFENKLADPAKLLIFNIILGVMYNIVMRGVIGEKKPLKSFYANGKVEHQWVVYPTKNQTLILDAVMENQTLLIKSAMLFVRTDGQELHECDLYRIMTVSQKEKTKFEESKIKKFNELKNWKNVFGSKTNNDYDDYDEDEYDTRYDEKDDDDIDYFDFETIKKPPYGARLVPDASFVESNDNDDTKDDTTFFIESHDVSFYDAIQTTASFVHLDEKYKEKYVEPALRKLQSLNDASDVDESYKDTDETRKRHYNETVLDSDFWLTRDENRESLFLADEKFKQSPNLISLRLLLKKSKGKNLNRLLKHFLDVEKKSVSDEKGTLKEPAVKKNRKTKDATNETTTTDASSSKKEYDDFANGDDRSFKDVSKVVLRTKSFKNKTTTRLFETLKQTVSYDSVKRSLEGAIPFENSETIANQRTFFETSDAFLNPYKSHRSEFFLSFSFLDHPSSFSDDLKIRKLANVDERIKKMAELEHKRDQETRLFETIYDLLSFATDCCLCVMRLCYGRTDKTTAVEKSAWNAFASHLETHVVTPICNIIKYAQDHEKYEKSCEKAKRMISEWIEKNANENNDTKTSVASFASLSDVLFFVLNPSLTTNEDDEFRSLLTGFKEGLSRVFRSDEISLKSLFLNFPNYGQTIGTFDLLTTLSQLTLHINYVFGDFWDVRNDFLSDHLSALSLKIKKKSNAVKKKCYYDERYENSEKDGVVLLTHFKKALESDVLGREDDFHDLVLPYVEDFILHHAVNALTGRLESINHVMAKHKSRSAKRRSPWKKNRTKRDASEKLSASFYWKILSRVEKPLSQPIVDDSIEKGTKRKRSDTFYEPYDIATFENERESNALLLSSVPHANAIVPIDSLFKTDVFFILYFSKYANCARLGVTWTNNVNALRKKTEKRVDKKSQRVETTSEPIASLRSRPSTISTHHTAFALLTKESSFLDRAIASKTHPRSLDLKKDASTFWFFKEASKKYDHLKKTHSRCIDSSKTSTFSDVRPSFFQMNRDSNDSYFSYGDHSGVNDVAYYEFVSDQLLGWILSTEGVDDANALYERVFVHMFTHLFSDRSFYATAYADLKKTASRNTLYAEDVSYMDTSFSDLCDALKKETRSFLSKHAKKNASLSYLYEEQEEFLSTFEIKRRMSDFLNQYAYKMNAKEFPFGASARFYEFEKNPKDYHFSDIVKLQPTVSNDKRNAGRQQQQQQKQKDSKKIPYPFESLVDVVSHLDAVFYILSRSDMWEQEKTKEKMTVVSDLFDTVSSLLTICWKGFENTTCKFLLDDVYCKTIANKNVKDNVVYETYDRIVYSERTIPHVVYDVQLAHKKYALRFCMCALSAMSIPFFKRFLKSLHALDVANLSNDESLWSSVERFEKSMTTVLYGLFQIKTREYDITRRVTSSIKKSNDNDVGDKMEDRAITKKTKKWNLLNDLLNAFKNKKIEKNVIMQANRFDTLLFFLDRL